MTEESTIGEAVKKAEQLKVEGTETAKEFEEARTIHDLVESMSGWREKTDDILTEMTTKMENLDERIKALPTTGDASIPKLPENLDKRIEGLDKLNETLNSRISTLETKGSNETIIKDFSDKLEELGNKIESGVMASELSPELQKKLEEDIGGRISNLTSSLAEVRDKINERMNTLIEKIGKIEDTTVKHNKIADAFRNLVKSLME